MVTTIFGQWSRQCFLAWLSSALLFILLVLGNAVSSFAQVSKAEYFFDTDPGLGNGTSIPITAGATVNFTGSFSTSLLSPGGHTLHIRTKDNLGHWGLSERRLFFLLPTPVNSSSIVFSEYFFDTDPGLGNGTSIPITPNDTISASPFLSTNSLSTGFHQAFLRTKDNLGHWSLTEMAPLYKCGQGSVAGLQSWWSFDDATTNSPNFVDLAGNHNALVVNGPDTVFKGKFDGVDDFVGVPDNDAWAFGPNDFTIEFLASFSAPGGDPSHPGDKFIGQSEGPDNAKKWTFALGGGSLFFRVSDGTGSLNIASSSFSPTLNQLYHLAISRSGNTFSIYVNGQLAASEVVAGLQMPNVNSAMTIGHVDWVQGGGDQGYMSGKLDEMTIYHRALSQLELQAISNSGPGGKCKVLHLTTVVPDVKYGTPFFHTMTAANGVEPYTWSVVGGALPEGVTLNANGTLGGTPAAAGTYSFTAKVKDAVDSTAQKGFVMSVLVTMPKPKFSIFKSGTTAVPGRNMDYFIQLENLGSARDTFFVNEFLEPWFKLRHADLPFVVESQAKDYFFQSPTDSIPSILGWKISLDPGDSKIFNYNVKLHPELLLNKKVKGTATGSPRDIRDCFPIYDSERDANAKVCNKLFQTGESTYEQYLGCVDLGDEAATARFLRCCNGESEPGQGGNSESGDSVKVYRDIKPTQGPVDPNEKLVLAPRYIKPDQLLVYPIHYENIGTIEAQDVFVKDTLSPFLDLKSLKIISQTGSSVDTLNRVVKWDLLGTNLQPDSSAYVLYSAKPKAGLPNGTIIRNRAAIKFEVFQTFITNETINIIDGLAPVSRMKPLPDTVFQTAIPIRWKGVDSVGELKDYTVFVSVNGGSYTPFLRNTTDTAAYYLGQPGKTYRFICVAEDVAGNQEIKGSDAEATTYIKVLCANKFFRDADGDNYGSRLLYNFSCTQPAGFISDSLDCDDSRPEVHPGGTEVCSLYDENCNGTNNENNVCVLAINPSISAGKLNNLLVYPNPSNGLTNLVFYCSDAEKTDLKVADLLGRTILKKEIQSTPGENTILLDLQKMNNGIYLITLSSEKRKPAQVKYVKQ